MDHPYIKLEKTALWEIVRKALNELRENQDIEITTKDEYVIGFLCQSIIENEDYGNGVLE